MIKLIPILLVIASCACSSTLYKATRNISTTNFYSMLTRTVQRLGHLDCAHSCHYWETLEGTCNTYNYEETSRTCNLAKLTFLEDPAPGEAWLAIMVDTGVLEGLELRCRGGESCCVRNCRVF